MENRKILVLSNGPNHELEHLVDVLEIKHLQLNGNFSNIKIHEEIHGIFFAKDIDAMEISKIIRQFDLKFPMARILQEIYSPVKIENVETLENTTEVVSHFKKFFANN